MRIHEYMYNENNTHAKCRQPEQKNRREQKNKNKTKKRERKHYEESSNGFFNQRHRNVRNIVIQILGSQLA